MRRINTWDTFKKFISNSDISDDVKQREGNRQFRSDHRFYLNLFSMLSPAFPNVEQSVVERLSLAGYLYFRTTLLLDRQFDTTSENTTPASIEQMMLCMAYHERSIKELTSVFGADHDFWEEFDVIKKKYLEANILEKKISGEQKPFTKELFTKLAAGKSGLSIASVLALCSAGNNFKPQKPLEQSLLAFHTGFQLFDDIDDFKQDIQNGQWTYAIYRVERFIEGHIDYQNPGINTKYKYLFISGIAADLLQEAKSYYQKALSMVDDLPVDAYKSRIKSEIGKCDKLLWEIEQLLCKTQQKANRSRSLKQATPVEQINVEDINNAIHEGVQYLKSTLDESNRWSDFLTNAGLGSGWITNYVCYQLHEARLVPELTSSVVKSLGEDASEIGSYNDFMIRDGDSLNFIVGMHSLLPQKQAEQLVSHWLSYQRKEGGWGTYNDPASLRKNLELDENEDVRGWTISHPCVSAVAACVLKNLDRYAEEYRQTISWLADQQTEEGYLPSYWWTSPVYSTSFFLMAISGREGYTEQQQKAEQWLVEYQASEGAWETLAGESNANPFYTSVALKALFTAAPRQYRQHIDRGILWLLNHQLDDGSWPVSRILRLPAPDIVDPASVQRWRKSSFGVNVLVDDHIGNFTTATVINTLAWYRKLNLETGIEYETMHEN